MLVPPRGLQLRMSGLNDDDPQNQCLRCCESGSKNSSFSRAFRLSIMRSERATESNQGAGAGAMSRAEEMNFRKASGSLKVY